MNERDLIKQYQNNRQQATDFAQSLQSSSAELFTDLESISSFVNDVPNQILYRKQLIQHLVADVIQSVDQIRRELILLNTDCSIQIYSLIVREKLKQLQEMKNEKTSNARVAGQFGNKRKRFTFKKSKKRR